MEWTVLVVDPPNSANSAMKAIKGSEILESDRPDLNDQPAAKYYGRSLLLSPCHSTVKWNKIYSIVSSFFSYIVLRDIAPSALWTKNFLSVWRGNHTQMVRTLTSLKMTRWTGHCALLVYLFRVTAANSWHYQPLAYTKGLEKDACSINYKSDLSKGCVRNKIRKRPFRLLQW